MDDVWAGLVVLARVGGLNYLLRGILLVALVCGWVALCLQAGVVYFSVVSFTSGWFVTHGGLDLLI